MLAPVVRFDVDGVPVFVRGRFPVHRFEGRDAECFAVFPVAAFGNDGGAGRFQLGGECGQRGGAVALVAQLLGDVQEHVGFVHDDRFQFLGGVLVAFELGQNEGFFDGVALA